MPDEIALHGPFDHHDSSAVPPARRAADPTPTPTPQPTAAAPAPTPSSAPAFPSAPAPTPSSAPAFSTAPTPTPSSVSAPAAPSPHDQVRLLFFGTIRPYKGLEDLVEVFGRLPSHYTLTVVGETWEGWTLPAAMIADSPAADRITFVNRYVADSEVDGFFAAADVVVLPYRRSSASGPLHIAMSHGLPVVVTSVGGLVEAASEYSGTTFVAAGSPSALGSAIVSASANAGRRHPDPSSWEKSVAAFTRLFARMGVPVAVAPDLSASAQDAEITASSNQTVPVFSPDLR
ncbi:glycosyltransferase [Actinoplanes sp. LDG1-01]|uniref:Glycosyltransferase n=1 Tax=Paractinoplanes lichenicola TaxID=2802976 RepID=A0ABS1VGY1_9ACTN|nr:glycosyltransferase [Actinoplanes lichenicola]